MILESNDLGRMSHFRDLRVWDLAVAISLEVHALLTPSKCRLHPEFRYNTLKAARSVPDNIAESTGRTTVPDKLHFLDISRGSLHELENAIEQAFRKHLIAPRQRYRLVSRTSLCGRMLTSLYKQVAESEDEGRAEQDPPKKKRPRRSQKGRNNEDPQSK